MSRRSDLLGEIEDDLLAGLPLADLLRKSIILARRAGSADLRAWASRELKGYDGVDADNLPNYRRVAAPMYVDKFIGAGMLTGQPISSRDLPDGIREELGDELLLRQGVGELEALAARGETMRFGPPGFEIIGQLMDNESRVQQRTTAIYWTVTPATLHGVVDQVRTALAELVGELGESTPSDTPPATDQVNQAVRAATSDEAGPQANLGHMNDLDQARPSVFIGSSKEGLKIAEYLQLGLEERGVCWAEIWTQGAFRASGYTLESLEGAAKKADFAVLVATPDDVVDSRGADSPAPRDNVIFELGLFIGALGRERTYIVADTALGLRLPSDLQGLTWLPYERRPDKNEQAAILRAVHGIAERIRTLGPRGTTVTYQSGETRSAPASGSDRALAREIERICSDARAQGWHIRSNSETTLRLRSPRGRTYTFSIGEANTSRVELRRFAAELRAGGLRVNRSVRRSVDDVPATTV